MVGFIRTGMVAAVILTLTACGGDSDSTSESAPSGSGSSGAGGGSTTAVTASTFANKNYFTLDPKGTSLYHITTLRFGDANTELKGGQGYLDGTDFVPSWLDGAWKFENDALVLSDFNWQLTVVKQDTDFIELCGSDYPGAKLTTCADNVREVWYTDKAKAKAFVASKSSGTTPDLTDTSVPDEKLRALFNEMEMDFTEQLTRLYARERGIANLKGIEQFSNIERLQLTENKITDISALSSLTKLTRLYVEDQSNSDNTSQVSIDSFAAIEGMKSLTRLWMGSYDASVPTNKFNVSTFLAQLTDKSKLTELRMSNVGLTNADVVAISGLPNLVSLRIEESPNVTNLTGWKNDDWSKLKRLEVGYNGDGNTATTFDLDTMISDGLDLSQLTHLKLAQTNATDANLTTIGDKVGGNLINLDLRSISNSGYDFGATFSVPNLQQLRLSKSGVTYSFSDLAGDVTTNKLTTLYLEKGTIPDFTGADFDALTNLRVRKSNLSNIADAASFVTELKKMTKLTRLDIRDTTLTSNAVTCTDLTIAGLDSSVSCRDS